MDKITRIFIESPIASLNTIGDFSKSHSFKNKTDRSILTNPKSVQKIKDKFANTEAYFDMYFVNKPEAGKYLEEGEVSEEFIRNNLKITPEEAPINKNNITVFYTNNTGDERVMMTAWVIAHRFGHVIRNLDGYKRLTSEIREILGRILGEAYESTILSKKLMGSLKFPPDNDENRILKSFSQEIGTFKSAREKNLRSYYEFEYELLAQYITTGKISFNHLPRYIPTKYTFGRPTQGLRLSANENDAEYYYGYLKSLANDVYPDYADECLRECTGRIFVM